MLKNAYQKALIQDSRITSMNVMKWCLEMYKKTNDEVYWEWAKVFGEWSKLYKKQLDELK